MNPLSPPSFQGYFWLSSNPDSQVPGNFYCTNEGNLRLELLGEFPGESLGEIERKIPRILGYSAAGKQVTFENCFHSSKILNMPGLITSTIHVNLALIGCHFEKDAPICFDKITCYSDAINDWLEFAPIEGVVTTSPQSRATISFSTPDPLEWEISEGIKIKIHSSGSAPNGIRHREAKITQRTWVSFEYNKLAPLGDLLNITNRFCRFVSLAVDQPIPLNAIQVSSASFADDDGRNQHDSQVQVYFATDIRASPDLTRLASPFPLISFRWARERFGVLARTFMDNYSKYDSSFNLYFATKSGRDLYNDNRFLMLAQATESLHRHSSTESLYTKDEYDSLCHILETATPAKYKEWLKSKLAYGNELSLRHRLKQLFDGFESIYGGRKKVAALISRIIDTRNYLTHYNPTLRQRAARGKDIWRLCLVLETLFQLHMAMLCGLHIDEVITLCKSSITFKEKIAHTQSRSSDYKPHPV